jgi:UDP-N-acetylglucosamine--N-acetylmuramyl-(pentapeptide) pyrophosphoryl-undecaprenol N-acetylglucosamine transferase
MNADAPVMIMAGGTGGHIFPGISVARALLAEGVPVVWLGSRHGLENTLVPRADLKLETIDVSGVRGKGLLTLATAPIKLARAIAQAANVMRRHRPRAALSFGGFAAGPGGIAAKLGGIPVFVHEQNRIPGMTNRVLARIARAVFAGFPDAFTAARGEWTGNPVRAEIAQLPAPAARFAGRGGALRLLVLGGSQGAMVLNRVVPAALATSTSKCCTNAAPSCSTARAKPMPRSHRTRASSPSSTTWRQPTRGPISWSAAAAR